MKQILMAIPSFVASAVAALPVLTCPACWPLYAGLLSALGLGFVDYTPFLFPLTSLLLMVAIFPLVHKATERRGYRPAILGTLSSLMILTGKFWLEINLIYYLGILILIVTSIWNLWPKKDCKKCVSEN